MWSQGLRIIEFSLTDSIRCATGDGRSCDMKKGWHMRIGNSANARQTAPDGSHAKSRDVVALFLISLVVRLIYVLGTGTSVNFIGDSPRYDLLSDRALSLSFDFEQPEFIVSPGYPIFLAVIKFVAGTHWISVMETVQAVLSAAETVLLFGIAHLLWQNRRISVLAAIGHAFYPPNLLSVPYIAQETLFEFFWVASIYWLIRSVKDGTYRSVCISALSYGLGYLTKSHILLFSPFICVYYLLNNDTILESAKKTFVFGVISVLMSVPWGVHNWRTKDAYILSSSGYGSHFLVAHNDDFYTFLFDTPPIGSPEWSRLNKWTDLHVFEEINAKRRETGMSDKEFQKMCYSYGVQWCRENPDKLFWMNVRDFVGLLRPGASKSHQPFKVWLASFLICTPVFVLACAGIVRNLISNFRLHFWILGIFLSMLVYVYQFYFQARFRAITIEQFYLIYCAFMIDFILSRMMRKDAAKAPQIDS